MKSCSICCTSLFNNLWLLNGLLLEAVEVYQDDLAVILIDRLFSKKPRHFVGAFCYLLPAHAVKRRVHKTMVFMLPLIIVEKNR